MIPTDLAELLSLPPDERLDIIEALWDSLAKTPKSVTVPAWHRRVLDERLAVDHEADGEDCAVVKAHLQRRV